MLGKVSTLTTALIMFSPNTVDAQTQFRGGFAFETNPYGLTNIGSISEPNLIDADGDGDLDLMSGNNNGELKYFENTAGAGSIPFFATVQTNPFNLSDVGFNSNSNLVDLDNEGDLDLMSGEFYGSFYYFENITLLSTIIWTGTTDTD